MLAYHIWTTAYSSITSATWKTRRSVHCKTVIFLCHKVSWFHNATLCCAIYFRGGTAMGQSQVFSTDNE